MRFFVVAFGIPWLVYPLLLLDSEFGMLLLLVMFAPTYGVLATGEVRAPQASIGALKMALPAAAWLLLALLFSLPIAWPAFDVARSIGFILWESLGIELPRSAVEYLARVSMVQVLVLPLAIIINSVFAFGEEYGWRGYLLPKLSMRFGPLVGSIVVGVVWGLWHAPVILAGHNYFAEFWWPGIPLFTVFTVEASLLLSWAYLRYGTWGSAVCHGAINAVSGLYFFFYVPDPPWLLNPAGIAGILGMAPLAVWSALKIRGARFELGR